MAKPESDGDVMFEIILMEGLVVTVTDVMIECIWLMVVIFIVAVVWVGPMD